MQCIMMDIYARCFMEHRKKTLSLAWGRDSLEERTLD